MRLIVAFLAVALVACSFSIVAGDPVLSNVAKAHITNEKILKQLEHGNNGKPIVISESDFDLPAIEKVVNGVDSRAERYNKLQQALQDMKEAAGSNKLNPEQIDELNDNVEQAISMSGGHKPSMLSSLLPMNPVDGLMKKINLLSNLLEPKQEDNVISESTYGSFFSGVSSWLPSWNWEPLSSKLNPKHHGYGMLQTEVCEPEIGCFEKGGDFLSAGRPVNWAPESRKKVNTIFNLYTRENRRKPQEIRLNDTNALRQSSFDGRKPTKYIVHGFLEYHVLETTWQEEMKDELLNKEDMNVFVIVWKGGNFFPYTQAVANTRVVGREIGLMMRFLGKETGAKTKSAHCIGHSLGAHVCGYAGDWLNYLNDQNVAGVDKLARITALDAADPLYLNTKPRVRVDPTDALLVDSIHSNANQIGKPGFGLLHTVGHLDFYPNSGQNQPQCRLVKNGPSSPVIAISFPNGIDTTVRKVSSCDHQSSVDYFIESINNEHEWSQKTEFAAFTCSNWDNFASGQCNTCESSDGICAKMGYEADRYRPLGGLSNSREHKLYLRTSDRKPYSTNYYNVEVPLSNDKKTMASGVNLMVKMIGDRASETVAVSQQMQNYEGLGKLYTSQMIPSLIIGDIKEVQLRLKYSAGITDIFNLGLFRPKLYIQEIRIHEMFHTNGNKAYRFVNTRAAVDGVGDKFVTFTLVQ